MCVSRVYSKFLCLKLYKHSDREGILYYARMGNNSSIVLGPHLSHFTSEEHIFLNSPNFRFY